MARGLNVFVNIGAKVGSSVGSAARATERRFEQMGRRIKVIGAEMKATLKGVEEAQERRRTRLFEGAAFAYGVSRAMAPFVDFEDALVRMGNTAEVHGAKLDAVGKDIIQSGARFGYGGRAAIAGANDFIAAGESMQSALGALQPTLMLAKTAGVEITEASQAGISVMQNLGVKATELGLAFDYMAKAGKEGRFEINDMAKAFPGVASRANVLGMKGLDGVKRMSAMLQIVRTNARDADEAGNNLLNFLDKLTSSDSDKKFSKMGVDIEAVFKRSQKRGTDFVDDMLDIISKKTKGGTDGFAMSALFEDRQARAAAIALVQQRKEYERIRKAAGEGAGTLKKDFDEISKTSKFGLNRAAAGLERVGIALGKAFGPAIGDAAERLADLSERFANWAEKNPRMVKAIGYTIMSFMGLRTAIAAVGFVFGGVSGRIARFLIGGLARLAFRGFGMFTSIAGRVLVGGLMRLGPLMLRGLIAAAPWVLRGIVGLLNPVGLAVMIGLAAAYLIYTYRDAIAAKWGEFTNWWRTSAWPAVMDTVSALSEIGGRIVDSIINGLAANWGRLKSWFAEKWNGLVPGFMEVGASAPAAPKPAGARALGGSWSGNRPYLVGERGPELAVPGRSGTIVPAHVTAALARGGGSSGGFVHKGDVNIYGATDPKAVAREVEATLKRLAGRQAALLSD